MTTYPLEHDIAFVVDGKLASLIQAALFKVNAPVPDDYGHPADVDLGYYVSEFDGMVNPAFPDTGFFAPVNLENGYLRYIPFPEETAESCDREALLQQVKDTIADYCGGELPANIPADFNWWQHFAAICGTYNS